MSYQDIQEFLQGSQQAQQEQQFLSDQQNSDIQQQLTRNKAGEGILSIKGAESFREGLNIKGFLKDKFNKKFDEVKDKVKQSLNDKVDETTQQVRDQLNEVVPEETSIENPTQIKTIGDLSNESDEVISEYQLRIGNTSDFNDFKSTVMRKARENPERELAPDKQDIATNAKQHVEARNAEPVEEEPVISQQPEMTGDIELTSFASEPTTTLEEVSSSTQQFLSPEITGALRGDTTLARALNLGRQTTQNVVSQAQTTTQEASNVLPQIAESTETAAETTAGAVAEAGTTAAEVGAEAGAEAGIETAGASLLEDPFTAIAGLGLLIAGFVVGDKKPKEAALPAISSSKQFGV